MWWFKKEPSVPRKKLLCLDFDGVLHSYTSGWKGAGCIPDPPVPGAMEFLIGAVKEFDVCIFSARSRSWRGRLEMRAWLREQLFHVLVSASASASASFTTQSLNMELDCEAYYDFIDAVTEATVQAIRFPIFKPPAFVTLDDRALRFDGEFPSMETLKQFKPWYAAL